MTHERYAGLDAAGLKANVDAAAADPTTGLSASATRTLGYQWRFACRWWEAHGIALPVTEHEVVRLLTACEGNAHSTLRSLVHAVGRFHDAQYGQDPCGAGVAKFLTGYARLYGTAPNPVAALRPDEYRALLDAAPRCLSPYRAARLRFCLTIAYCGWLRSHEVLCIRWGGILGDGLGYSAFVPHSKTAPGGVVVGLAPPEGSGIDITAELRIWHQAATDAGVVLHKGDPMLPTVRNPATGISYNAYLQDLKLAARTAGLSRRIATHSPRRGGATTKAKHHGSVEELLAQGRWETVEIAMGYVEEWDAYDPALQVDYPAASSPVNPSSPATSKDSRSASSM